MEVKLKFLSAVLLIFSHYLGLNGRLDLYFLFSSVSLGLFSLTESEIPLNRRLQLKNYRSGFFGKWPMTSVGKLCQDVAVLMAVIYFISKIMSE